MNARDYSKWEQPEKQTTILMPDRLEALVSSDRSGSVYTQISKVDT